MCQSLPGVPSTVATVSKQILECRQPGNEANVMKRWENYVTCKVWKLIGVKLYSQLNYQSSKGERGLELTSEILRCFLGQGGWYPPKLVLREWSNP